MVDVGLQKKTFFDEIIIYNRTDERQDRANSISVYCSDDGFSWKTLHVNDGSKFGGLHGEPLVVKCHRTKARFIRISLEGLTCLHLDKIKIFDNYPDLNKCEEILKGKNFFVALNNSGIGDQIMSARVAAWLGEIFGMNFSGLDGHSPGLASSRSAATGMSSPKLMMEAMGLEGLIQTKLGEPNIISIPYGLDILNMGTYLANFALESPESTISIQLDGAEADFYIKKLSVKDHHDFFQTKFDFTWRANTKVDIASRFNILHNKKDYLLIHLRLGDITNIVMPDGRTIIPNHLAHLGPILGLVPKESGIFFERYDKRKEIQKILSLIKHSDDVVLHSDGFDFAYKIIQNYSDIFSAYYPVESIVNELKKVEVEFREATSHIKSYVGENAGSFDRFIKDANQATHIVSTTGHFAFNIATSINSLKEKKLLVERLDRTMIAGKVAQVSFWSDDIYQDLIEFAKPWIQ